jgi:hypothetical protein
MTPSRVPPIMEDEEEYLGWLPSESIVIRAVRLHAYRRRIEHVTKTKALIHKMNGEKPYWVRCMQRADLLAQGDICGGQLLKGTSMDWI